MLFIVLKVVKTQFFDKKFLFVLFYNTQLDILELLEFCQDKSKFHTSGNKPKKMAIPVGSYQLKLGTQFFTLTIKDGETVEM